LLTVPDFSAHFVGHNVARRTANIVSGAVMMRRILLPHPGIDAAVTERNQPCASVAAVFVSKSATAAKYSCPVCGRTICECNLETVRALPPTLSSQGAPLLAEAFNDASAFSSVIRMGVRIRDAVASTRCASVATADRARKNSRTLRTATVIAIAEQQPSISSGV
jgi:predicted RNA-binding Zn-ribbon protein involved in translation (DUF1610 family)